jgi:hypothetical protein
VEDIGSTIAIDSLLFLRGSRPEDETRSTDPGRERKPPDSVAML